MKRIALSLALLGLAATATVAAAVADAEPLLIYNPSQSVPSGFYLRADRSPRRGDYVTVAAARVAPDYTALRDYADPTDRFLKRVAAGAGQRVCAEGADVSVDGEAVALRLAQDGQSRALPTWRGCHTLTEGEVFLLGDTPDSFDGRYWGPTHVHLIDGVWTPL